MSNCFIITFVLTGTIYYEYFICNFIRKLIFQQKKKEENVGNGFKNNYTNRIII